MSAVNLEMDLESLVPIEVPIKYQGKKYVLKEAGEGVLLEYREASLKLAKPNVETGKPTSIEGLQRAGLDFLAHCLFEVVTEGRSEPTRVPVPVEVVLAWPSKVVKILRDKLQEITGLREEESEESFDKQIAVLAKQKEALAKLRETSKN